MRLHVGLHHIRKSEKEDENELKLQKLMYPLKGQCNRMTTAEQSIRDNKLPKHVYLMCKKIFSFHGKELC